MARETQLKKSIEGTVVIFGIKQDEGGEYTEKKYDFASLPEVIQAKLGPFGLGHKLGDAAASATNHAERCEFIDKVWDSLLESEWSVRRPGEPKEKSQRVSKKVVLENLLSMSEDERALAMSILAKLGISFAAPAAAEVATEETPGEEPVPAE